MPRVLFSLACLGILLTGSHAEAQRRVPGFVNRPAISPYFNLFNNNNGGINNYFNFVRPRLEMEQYVRDTNRQLAFDRSLIQQEAVSFQREIQAIPGAILQQRPSKPTGATRRPAASFMRLGNFYPASPAINQRTR